MNNDNLLRLLSTTIGINRRIVITFNGGMSAHSDLLSLFSHINWHRNSHLLHVMEWQKYERPLIGG